MEIVHQMRMVAPESAQMWAQISAGTVGVAAIVMNLFVVRYLHIGRLLGRRPVLLWGAVALSLVLVFTPYFGMMLLAMCAVYLFSPLFTWRIDPAQAQIEERMARPRADS